MQLPRPGALRASRPRCPARGRSKDSESLSEVTLKFSGRIGVGDAHLGPIDVRAARSTWTHAQAAAAPKRGRRVYGTDVGGDAPLGTSACLTQLDITPTPLLPTPTMTAHSSLREGPRGRARKKGGWHQPGRARRSCCRTPAEQGSLVFLFPNVRRSGGGGGGGGTERRTMSS